MSESELRAKREALGLSVSELAREFWVQPITVYRWEREGGPPKGLQSIGADAVLRRLAAERRRNERRRNERAKR
jgi:DNA-binding transcriptional regulator YiaG